LIKGGFSREMRELEGVKGKSQMSKAENGSKMLPPLRFSKKLGINAIVFFVCKKLIVYFDREPLMFGLLLVIDFLDGERRDRLGIYKE